MPTKRRVGDEVTKRLTLEITDHEKQTVTARFATFNVVDMDGDLTEPGAFGVQEVFMGAWNHNPHMLPPGMGKTREDGDNAIFEGTFFESMSGKDHYELIKAAGGQMEWSYRFFIEEGALPEVPIGTDAEEAGEDDPYFIIRRAKITHVAPVEAGAGIGTGTLDIKCRTCNGEKTEHGSLDNQKLTAAISSLTQALAEQRTFGLEDIDKAFEDALARRASAEAEKHAEACDGCESCNKSDDEKGCGGSHCPGCGKSADDDEKGCGGSHCPGCADKSADDDEKGCGGSHCPGCADKSADDDEKGCGGSHCPGCADKSADGSHLKGDGLGNHIRTLRDSNGVSNEALAEAAGVSVATVGQVLGGTLDPRLDWLQGFASALGVTLSSLVSVLEEDQAESEEEPPADESSDDGAEESAAEESAAEESDEDGDKGMEPLSETAMQQLSELLDGFGGDDPESEPKSESDEDALAAYETFRSTFLD